MTIELVPNPAYAGQEPRLLRADCHDRTPFITFVPDCGHEGHVHEGQLAVVPDGCALGVRCADCSAIIVFEPGQLEAAFKQLRDEGWIE